MIRYLDWAQEVLRVVLADRPAHKPLTIWSLPAELGIPLDARSEEDRKAVTTALDHVLRDLAPHGLVKYDGGHFVEYPPDARRFRVEPLRSIWTELRSGYFDPDEALFLAAAAQLSERPGAEWADTVEITPMEVLDALNWDWDEDRVLTIYRHLSERRAIVGVMYGTAGTIRLRITYKGLVRALDAVGSLLQEAHDHLAVGRLRAAGCVAAVELERRLKAIAPHPAWVKKRDPGLEDYNKAAFDARVIDQETWSLISRLATIRKRCVHVLDREPTSDEVGDLIDGVDDVLRRHPVAQP